MLRVLIWALSRIAPLTEVVEIERERFGQGGLWAFIYVRSLKVWGNSN